MNWTEVQIKTTAELEDLVSSILYDAGATGLAIEDPRDILELAESIDRWDFVDPNLVNVVYDGIIIKAYFAESDDLEKKIQYINNRINTNPAFDTIEHKVKLTLVNEKDWAESWKRFYKPTKIGEKIVIKPSWENYDPVKDEIIVELDPGMAFGTGTHETTSMCIEALEKHVKSEDIVFDIGCGSGILSIVAAKLGANKVTGIDLDPVCIKVSNENIVLNQVEDAIEIKQGNLLDVVEGKANIIVSNIIAEIIAKMTADIREYLHDDGIFITSGIIEEKIDLVEESLLENGFKIEDIIKRNGWACIIAKLK